MAAAPQALDAVSHTSQVPLAGGTLFIQLTVSDPDVIAELVKYPDAPERERYALTALRVGVLALRQARGELDAGAIREAGQLVLRELESLLHERGTEITNTVTSALRQYFDPASGELPRRLESLLKQDGELDRFLRQHLGPESSTLAQTLRDRLAPLLALLDPDQAQGLRARIEETVGAALHDQRNRILAEFTLDNEQSALSRLVRKLTETNDRLTGDIKELVNEIAAEFSLDKPDSALCRLIQKLEDAQGLIGKSLTLDNQDSPLSKLKRELQDAIDRFVQENAKFQADVREILGEFKAQRRAEARTTLHGLSFQERLGQLLQREASRLNDVFEATAAVPGEISRCKTGDFVIQLGEDTAAPGARIVWEAKAAEGFTLPRARAELDEARKNRRAQIGVFVFYKGVAPAGIQCFARHGNDLIVVWDPEDPTTDVYVQAAYSVARALVVRETRESVESQKALAAIAKATQTIESQLEVLGQIKTWAETVKTNGEKIAARADSMKATITAQIEELNRNLAALKANEAQG